MDLEFREITRGNGKIFIHLEGAGTAQQLDATSHTGEGNELPARVIPAPAGVEGAVLVVPVTASEQTVEVNLADMGEKLGQLVLAAEDAKRRSQKNTLFRNKTALAIRNCDEGIAWKRGNIALKVLRCIDHGDEDILHIELTMQSDDKALADLPYEFRLQDAEGRNLFLADKIVLGDSCKEDYDFPGWIHRRIVLSGRIPHSLVSATAWFRCGMGEVVELWDAETFKAMREKWFHDSLSADRDPIYDEWYRTRHQAKPWQLEAQRQARFKIEPVFSVIVPLYKTPVPFFNDMVSSVTNQTWAKWELILVNSTPEDKELAEAVASAAKQDSRIKIIDLPENKGIVGNTNEGIAAAAGDFVVFLDHDDIIEPDILYWYAKALNDYPTTDVLYCDEDKLHDGHYEQAFFKPDWSPDLLRSQNYVTHLLAIRPALLDEVGPLRSEFEGAQDHDLTLRATEKARNIFHVRRIGYHWRISETSTASASSAKDYASSAGCQAVQAQLDRLGVEAEAYEDERIPGVYHERFACSFAPSISIVIPNKDAAGLLSACVRSILEKTTYQNYEIAIVENSSTEEETFALYKELEALDKRVKIITYVPDTPGFNFSKIMNYGIRHTTGDVVLMLNNDMEIITPDWLQLLLGHVQEKRVGCVGAKLLYADGTIQHAGVIVHRGGPSHTGIFIPHDSDNYFHAAQVTRNFLGVTGACLMVRREVFDEMDGLDESYAVDFNDVDFCLRVRDAGYWNVYEPLCEIYHFESVSRGKNDTPPKRVRFKREGAKIATGHPSLYEITDPYMNPNMWPINPYWHLDV